MTVLSAPAAASVQPIAAVAAAPLADLVLGRCRPAFVLGESSGATWLEVGDRVLVVSEQGGTRLPNALVACAPGPWLTRRKAAAVTVGGGEIRLADRRFRVARWWQPRPTLRPTRPGLVRQLAAACTRMVEPRDDRGLGHALAQRKPVDVLRAAHRLLGSGAGLTPEGDDVLVGALAAYRLVGRAVGTRSDDVLETFGKRLLTGARQRTTRLSASLLGHSLKGEVADPLAELLRAFTGGAPLSPAVHELHAVGHSSGPAMAFGALRGTWAITRMSS